MPRAYRCKVCGDIHIGALAKSYCGKYKQPTKNDRAICYNCKRPLTVRATKYENVYYCIHCKVCYGVARTYEVDLKEAEGGYRKNKKSSSVKKGAKKSVEE